MKKHASSSAASSSGSSSSRRQIRADFDRNTVVVYQAYSDRIADPALAAQKFVPPFSTSRMTWIKPSLLWLMERSNWGKKREQERILAVRLTRAGFDTALSSATLTNPERGVHATTEAWQAALDAAPVHVQWDPERSIRGASLDVDTIQLGLSRQVIGRFVDEWTTQIVDLTPLVHKARTLIDNGHVDKAKALLPTEKPYPVDDIGLRRRLGMLV